MRSLRPLLYLLIAGLSVGTSIAADADSQKPLTFDLKSGMITNPSDTKNSVTDMSSYSSFSTRPQKAVRGGNLGHALLGPALDEDRNVCYTIRSYKVKPKERFAEGESGRAGYSTCEMASGFRLRSADDDSQVKLK